MRVTAAPEHLGLPIRPARQSVVFVGVGRSEELAGWKLGSIAGRVVRRELASARRSALLSPNRMENVVVDQVESEDEDIVEAWSRRTDEPHILGVSAIRLSEDEWPWQVAASIAEYIRDEPLQSQMRAAMLSALSRVSGVEDVEEDERGIWVLEGCVHGRDLVLAAVAVVDQLASEAREVFATQYSSSQSA